MTMSLTDVTPLKEKDDHNACQETGIYVTHTKLFSKKNNTNNSVLFSTVCFLLTLQQCLATFDTSTALNVNVYKPPAPYECNSIDLRNDCEDFDKLKNCTVITGFLNIAQLPRNNAKCNFSAYQFENLREITDFLIISEVRNLTGIKKMFPNLTVIRGQQLFLNYALVITSAYDLEKIEFKSLIAIQRGHVFLDDNPKLCHLEKINWNRLTLRRGKNTIFLHKQTTQCPEEAKCNGCKRDSCWSNDVCQKLENDSVLSLMQETSECHPLCLGGCYNRTSQGCVLCKGWSDHGSCVNECPSDKYASSRYLRCYTREECIMNKKHFIYKNTCVEYCPNGYELNEFTKECDSCDGIDSCLRVCSPKFSNSVIYISSLMTAESIKGCQILNATVLVNINEYIDQEELVVLLKDVREIMGHLKINRSPYLTSLNFFQSLEKIHGLILENKLYALIIYNNQNLTDLWTPKPGFEILNGGMYIHANDKLCNTRIKQLRDRIQHDRHLDSFQSSDQEVLCSPVVLNLSIETLSHRSIKFYWPRKQTSLDVEVILRPLNDTEIFTENSELDTNVCERISWRRDLMPAYDLRKNATHFSYIVNNLQPHTRYACLVKTFGGDSSRDARSEIVYATTLFDIPMPPKIVIKSKSYDSLQIEVTQGKNLEGSQVVDYYIVEAYSMPDNKELLDTRDYCDEPILDYKDYGHEDYDDCCSRREKEEKDQIFLQKLKKDFSCNLDHPEFCKRNELENVLTNLSVAFYEKRLEAWEENFTLKSLQRYHLYVIQAQACNQAGCSSYSIAFSRTNYSTAADKIYDFSACKVPGDYEYELHFSEPKISNGYITSYALHFRNRANTNGSFNAHLTCITRLEHERNNFTSKVRLFYLFEEAAVRVNSLGYSTFIEWINITTCARSVSKLPRHDPYHWNVFLVCFLIGAVGAILWICYKRRYWRDIYQLRRYLPLHMNWNYLRTLTNISEDQRVLVDYFETIRFHNNSDDNLAHLVPRE